MTDANAFRNGIVVLMAPDTDTGVDPLAMETDTHDAVVDGIVVGGVISGLIVHFGTHGVMKLEGLHTEW